MTTYEALVSIAERREVDIMLLDFPEQVREKVGGIYADYPEYPFIIINKGLSPEMQTKALAHELAHHQLHRKSPDQRFYHSNKRVHNRMEKEADAFGARLIRFVERRLARKEGTQC